MDWYRAFLYACLALASIKVLAWVLIAIVVLLIRIHPDIHYQVQQMGFPV